ncbi:MAG: hypothetical protein ACYTG0_26040 [Planctomycetota bacterium]|jgi:hypothetical protein
MKSATAAMDRGLPFQEETGAERPLLTEIEGIAVPEHPGTFRDTGVDRAILIDLALKLAFTRAQFTTDYTSRQLCLPLPIVTDVLEYLRVEQLIEALGQEGPMNYRFMITRKGRERGAHSMAISGYVGPAPVSLHAYNGVLGWQLPRLPDTPPERVNESISALVLPDEVGHVAGLAVSSGRSLFLFGPPGNGKTTLGGLLHNSLRGELWIPHCVVVDNDIIRVFDPRVHEAAPTGLSVEGERRIDRRWIRIRRPYIIVGGEVTLDSLDLIYDHARGYYEAPLHFKANGGIFLLDDLGCQRIDPLALLNRWIVPLENRVDYLTLRTGQQIQVPFRQMLIISTNIDPVKVITPALLRRMGYRLYLGYPTKENYVKTFHRYAAERQLDVPPGLIEKLFARYEAQGRPLRSCEPRDLIERARDICGYRREPVGLSDEVMNIAWIGYFGNKPVEEE